MAKLAPTSIKYVIKAKIKAKGIVEKPDIIGAVFGQTEGLLGSELDLRELQRTGRIGRIEVNITSKGGKSEGEIIIPSALDSAETSLIAATLETIERVGPCEAEIKLEKVEDTRADKRKYVMDKAKKILKDLMESGGETDEFSEEIKESVRTGEITSYKNMPAGPGLEESDNIIIVEGRADVLNLLKYGIKNTIAVGGTGGSSDIVPITKEKTVTVFVDGDRGGKLIVKELIQKGADLDFVASAPEGKEVEELSQKETYKSLREKTPIDQYKNNEKIRDPVQSRSSTSSRTSTTRRSESRLSRESRSDSRGRGSRDRYSRDRGRSGRYDRRPSGPRTYRKAEPKPNEKTLFKKTMTELAKSKKACIFNERCEMLGKVPVSDLSSTLKTIDDPYAVVLDGKIDSRLSFVAKTKRVKFLVGTEADSLNTPVTILTKKDL